jgi:hypothetical protein
MPVIRREEVTHSPKLHRCSPEAQSGYAHFSATCPDDFGRVVLNVFTLVGQMFPRRDDEETFLRLARAWKGHLEEYEREGLIRTWEVDGVKFGELVDFAVTGNTWHRTPEPGWSGHEHNGRCIKSAINKARIYGFHDEAKALSIKLKELRERAKVREAEREPQRDRVREPERQPEHSSPPSPPSPLRNTATTAGARARAELRPAEGPQPSPLVDRSKLIAEGYELITKIAAHGDEDPTETLARNSTGNGKLPDARRVRLDGMSDDHLAQTLCDLRRDWAAREPPPLSTEARPFQPDPAATAIVRGVAARLKDSMGEHAHARWARVLVGIEVSETTLRVMVPNETWLAHFGLAYAAQISSAMEAEGVGQLQLELVPLDRIEGRAPPERAIAGLRDAWNTNHKPGAWTR